MSFSVLLAPLRPVARFAASLVDRVVCILGAVSFSQGPEFIQQYTQRLGGHLDEARRQLEQFSKMARELGMSLDGLIEHSARGADPVSAKFGEVVVSTRERVESLAAAEQALRDASLWDRPFVFLRHLDWQIAEGTWQAYKPAVPTTLEGLTYGGVGLVIALGLYWGISGLTCSGVARWRRKREMARAEAEAASLDAPPPSRDETDGTGGPAV
ncbi:DUF2937 family protein [Geminisphaera colitermitum]|uniref:DUF2937 family protein n=1 Tax=Geminisphaera colitermitum TaxID=1148786 RepID=UPI001E63C76C|nr:DUF2937 family protein [Geminisphaera colitermitum]